MRYLLLRWASSALVLGLCLQSGCRKPDPPEPEAVALPAQLKSYVLFRPGSYWVYRDSASRQTDSVWVVSTEMSEVRRLITRTKFVELKYEKFAMRTRSTLGGPDLVYSAERYCGISNRSDNDKLGPCWNIKRGLSLPNSTADIGGADVFPYSIPRDLRRPGYYVFGSIEPYWHSQPLVIAGRTYPDVMEVQGYADASEGGWPAHYYWVPALGIVQQRVWVRRVPHTRTLVRSRIVQ